jgi:hypothetical protein
MAASLLITYKDGSRQALHHPFSFQTVVNESWVPLAKRENLSLLVYVGDLWIRRREDAEQLLAELRQAETRLTAAPQSVKSGSYMLSRLSQVIPLVEKAVAEWDEVEDLSL